MQAAVDDTTFARAREGDREALTALLKRHAAALRDHVHGRIPKRWQSLLSEEDVIQQTFANAVRGIAEIEADGDGRFRKWLFTTADHNLLDAIKALETDKRGGNRRLLELSDDFPPDLGTSPTQGARRNEATTILLNAIAQLPETYAKVIRLYDLEGRSAEEVAAAMGRSVGAVFMLRERALGRLKDILPPKSQILTTSV